MMSANELECSREEHRIFHAKRGCCNTTIISLMPEIKSCYLMAEGITGRDEVKCLAGKKVMAAMEMGEEQQRRGKLLSEFFERRRWPTLARRARKVCPKSFADGGQGAT
jgi:hypothetical protein